MFGVPFVGTRVLAVTFRSPIAASLVDCPRGSLDSLPPSLEEPASKVKSGHREYILGGQFTAMTVRLFNVSEIGVVPAASIQALTGPDG